MASDGSNTAREAPAMSLQLTLDSKNRLSGLAYPVKISIAWMLQKFRCDVDYISSVCHGRCCEGSGKVLISLLPEEEVWQSDNGFKVAKCLLLPDSRTHKCPHKTVVGLCSLHGTPNKPFGCIASPFTINKNDTLIIRYRYISLRCHNADRGEPAYKTFKPSLVMLFGEQEYHRIIKIIQYKGNDAVSWMPVENYRKLKYLDNIKKVKL